MQNPSNLILGIESTSLTANERDLFAELKPLGLIVFARNLETTEQIQALTTSFRETVDNPQALVLIDQEGGRVSRLPASDFRVPPSPTVFASMFEHSPEKAMQACLLNHILIGYELKQLGINVNCAPMIDIPQQNADKIVTERAFGSTPKRVIALAEKVIHGLQACGVEPVIKHAPGHGRATSDSHLELPIVNADIASLESWDFQTFKAFANQTMMMTAHIKYMQIDPELPGTLSPIVIQEIIRQQLGFAGLIMTDDIDMHALSGSIQQKAQLAFEAGCDVVLQCSGEFEKMEALSSVASELSGDSLKRAELAQVAASKQLPPLNYQSLLAEFTELMKN